MLKNEKSKKERTKNTKENFKKTKKLQLQKKHK